MLQKLSKLDRMAERWLNTLDGQIQEPVLQIMSGEVFTHGTTSDHSVQTEVVYTSTQEQPTQPPSTPLRNPNYQPEAKRPATLRKANAQ
ncbi:MAG TPA: hypothetical protein VHL11_16175 [Phototrophicaceae bacterium]|nr:hypothetical protein [Phototrophicaceae bacterium]